MDHRRTVAFEFVDRPTPLRLRLQHKVAASVPKGHHQLLAPMPDAAAEALQARKLELSAGQLPLTSKVQQDPVQASPCEMEAAVMGRLLTSPVVRDCNCQLAQWGQLRQECSQRSVLLPRLLRTQDAEQSASASLRAVAACCSAFPTAGLAQPPPEHDVAVAHWVRLLLQAVQA